MTSQVLYGLHRLETGKTYVAFDPSDNSKVQWSGRVLGSAGNGELVVIEQQDPGQTLAVVWNWNFFERGGVRANFHELGSSEVFDGLQPLITTDDSMAIAFELLVEQRRRPARTATRTSRRSCADVSTAGGTASVGTTVLRPSALPPTCTLSGRTKVSWRRRPVGYCRYRVSCASSQRAAPDCLAAATENSSCRRSQPAPSSRAFFIEKIVYSMVGWAEFIRPLVVRAKMQSSARVFDSLHALERDTRYRALHPENNDTLWMGRLRLVGVNADMAIVTQREETERYMAVTGWNAQRRVRPVYKLVDPNEIQVDVPLDSSQAEMVAVAEALMVDYAWASPSRLNVWARAVACSHGWYFRTVSNMERLSITHTTARFFRDANAARAIRGLLEAAGASCHLDSCAQT